MSHNKALLVGCVMICVLCVVMAAVTYPAWPANRNAEIFAAFSASAVFIPPDPTEPSDMLVWWDASDVDTVQLNGWTVTNLIDLTGNGYDATPADGTVLWTNAATVNGLPSLDLSTGNNSLAVPAGLYTTNTTTVFVFHRRTTNINSIAISRDDASRGWPFVWGNVGAGNENIFDTAPNVRYFASDPRNNLSTGVFVVIVRDDDPDEASTAPLIWLNGESLSTQQIAGGSALREPKHIGRHGSRYHDGYWFECRVYDNNFLATNDIPALTDHLMAKWGIPE